jgi:putative transferase (TIGR04331 family)
LLHYVQALYDRYAHVQHAVTELGRCEVVLLDEACFTSTTGCLDLVLRLIGDEYNLQAFSGILSMMGHEGPRRRFSLGAASAGKRPSLKRLLGRAANGVTAFGLRVLSGPGLRRGSVLVGDLYADRIASWALCLRTAGVCVPWKLYPGVLTMRSRPDHPARGELALLPATSEFERIALSLAPRFFPRLYLEGFSEIRRRVRRVVVGRPKAIVAAVGWFYDEAFKLLVAEAAEQGARVAAVQHGGGYGIDDLAPYEDHERAVSDRFFCWGWAGTQDRRLRDLPSISLSRASFQADTRLRTPIAEDVLLINNNYPRYLYRFHTPPVGESVDEYFAWIVRFARALAPEAARHLVVRPYGEDYGRGIRSFLTRELPGIRLDDGRPLRDRLHGARLVVIDHCATTVLEALSLNIPTVLLWDSAVWVPRATASDDMAALTDAGILHHSPEAAARTVSDVYSDPAGWWTRTGIQRVRREFVRHYAMSSRDWLSAWSSALLAIGTEPGRDL